MISGGSSGRSSQRHHPNSASQIRVKTLVLATPPCARTHSAARTMWGASGWSPASLSATTYPSTVVERSPGPPWKVAQAPSACCRERMNRAAAV